jgi:hypothetical protein
MGCPYCKYYTSPAPSSILQKKTGKQIQEMNKWDDCNALLPIFNIIFFPYFLERVEQLLSYF